MKRGFATRITALCLLAAMLLALIPATVGLAEAGADANTVRPKEKNHFVIDRHLDQGYVNNLVVVITKPGVPETEVLSWFPDDEAKVVGRFPRLNQLQIRIRARSRQALEELASALMAREQVLFAHLDLAAQMPGTQSKQSAIEELDEDFVDSYVPPSQQKPGDEWWYEAIGLQEAQKLAQVKQYVKVGVLDDGFASEHPDLRLKFLSDQYRQLNWPELHGSHVAGIVQQIMPGAEITVSDTYISREQDRNHHLLGILESLRYLVDMVESGAKVLNYSMGFDVEDEALMPWVKASAGIYSVYLWLLKQQGHEFIVVQSAGNMGLNSLQNGFVSSIDADNCLISKDVQASLGVTDKLKEAQQAVFDSILVVGATDRKLPSGRFSYQEGSNYGPQVSLAAPGLDINSTVPGGYMLMSGTSQAAPVATGTLGLIWSLRPKLQAGEVKRILLESATVDGAEDIGQLGPQNRRRLYPMLNALAAVQLALATPAD